jgi:hypothetical protein
MIDVQVLLRGSENREWLKQCLGSLEGHPVRVHLCRGIEGDLNRARLEGFSKGEAHLVSWVDPDDIVLPGAFQACLDAIGTCDAAYTREQLIRADGSLIGENVQRGGVRGNPMAAHHVVVVRRSLVERIAPYVGRHRFGAEWMCAAAAEALGGIVDSGVLGYQWRLHAGNSYKRAVNRVAGVEGLLEWLGVRCAAS